MFFLFEALNLPYFLEMVTIGLMMGIIYSLMGMSIILLSSVMKIVNFAQGEFFMIGSYIQYFLISYLLGPQLWALGIPITMFIVFLGGVLIQKTILRQMQGAYPLIVTIALSITIINIAIVTEGIYYFKPPDYYGQIVSLGLFTVSGNRVVAFGCAAILLIGLYIFLKYTWTGKAFRAAAQTRQGLYVYGLDPKYIDMLACGLGLSLAAAAGAVLAPIYLVYPTNGVLATVKGFEIIVIGGLGSIPGAFVASIILGLVETLGGAYISIAYKDVFGFILLILILILKPSGLFGEKERRV